MEKPSIPKGTRDFIPAEMYRRNYIFNIIRTVFENYGYMPIETPAMENLSSLLGKYGDEGDKLLFRILNSGNYLAGMDPASIDPSHLTPLTSHITERGLRYDLTVPFARFVVQNRNELSFPFKRYQIQPVWRADKPQRGRYREFYQCDVDVIGSDSLLNEVELIQIITEVFRDLKINVLISLNNRKILSAIATHIGEEKNFTAMTVAIDKLEKIGKDGVVRELNKCGFSDQSIAMLLPFLEFTGSNDEKLIFLKDELGSQNSGNNGVEETLEIFSTLKSLALDQYCDLDLTLARGLNYYTGTIIEVKSKDFQIGSICGGGRYDDLTGVFGLPDISGVGISFGADRIYDVMKGLNLFPDASVNSSDVFFVNFGKQEAIFCLKIADQLRKSGLRAEVYPENAKIKKQMKYAHQKSIPIVVLIGEEEMKSNIFSVKNMESGKQENIFLNDLVPSIRKELDQLK